MVTPQDVCVYILMRSMRKKPFIYTNCLLASIVINSPSQYSCFLDKLHFSHSTTSLLMWNQNLVPQTHILWQSTRAILGKGRKWSMNRCQKSNQFCKTQLNSNSVWLCARVLQIQPTVLSIQNEHLEHRELFFSRSLFALLTVDDCN